MSETILVVDDEQRIIDLARMYLEPDGFRVASATNGNTAKTMILRDEPSLVVLDLMLPGMDGLEVCRRVREESDVPIIMLTARSEDIDKIVGLELGADDYLTKPFNPRELLARIRAILRRTERSSAQAEAPPPVQVGNLLIDPQRRRVEVDGEPVDLRMKEFDLLQVLAENKGLVFSRDKLLNVVWGYDFAGQTRTVDVHVAHLRHKLRGMTPKIETVWGVGIGSMIAKRVRQAFDLRLRLLTSYLVLLVVTLGVIASAILVLIGASAAPAETTYERLAALTQGLNYIDFVADLPFDANARFLQDRVDELLDVFAESRQVRTLQIRATPEDTLVVYDSAGVYEAGQRIVLQRARYENRQLQKVLARGSEQFFGGFADPGGGEWLFGGVVFNSQRFMERQRANDLWLLAEPKPTLSLQDTLAAFGSSLAPPLIQAGIAGILIAIVLAALISRTIAQPLQRLARAATDVARGKYAVNVPESGPAELRSLAESFNRMTAEVQASNTAQRDFVSNVSHDLKTPLTSIQGYAQAIIDGAAEDTQAAAETIYEEASRLNRMVVELTDLERLQAGKLSMRREPIDMGKLCEGVVQSLTVVARQKDLDLSVELAPLPMVMGDGDRLAQVLVNLISNALKFTPAGGAARVVAEAVSGGAQVSIQDSGIGIPQDELGRVFERFYQVDKARGPQRGSGLGLAIAKEIVEAHGGRISVESGGRAQGAVFRVWLPGVE